VNIAIKTKPNANLQQQSDVSVKAALDEGQVRPEIRRILDSALAGQEVSEQQGVVLFQAEGVDIEAIAQCADLLRQRSVGERASFVITRNINFTNICYMGCKFCGFSKSKTAPDAQLLSMQEIANRAQQAWDRGASEVCIQGGLHPDLPWDHYRNILLSIKKQVPQMHIHAFSPFEIMYGAQHAKLSYKDFIQDLIDCGLGSMPGTAAEILDVEIRQQLTRDKLTTQQWCDIISTAHQLGLPTTATIMYGHIDGPRHWAAHIGLIREMQKKHRGFSEFVPLGFVHYESPLYTDREKLKLEVRPGPTANENILMHAVSRIMLNGWIDNIQASWVKLGPEYAVQMLRAGANDLGGTLMDETITRSSGGVHGEEILPEDMVKLIQRSGLSAYRRDTLYRPLEKFSADRSHIIASCSGATA